MIINNAYKFRIYPNQSTSNSNQQNDWMYLALYSIISQAYKETEKGLTYGTCSAKLPAMKKELVWLKEADSIAMQSSVRNLVDAYRCFKSKKNNVQSYTTKQTNENIAIVREQNKVAKTRPCSIYQKSRSRGRIVNATVRRNPSSRYFVSLLVKTEVQQLPKTSSYIGMDVRTKKISPFVRWNNL